ncbi:MAG: GerMN domain-containing protein [Clostridia bacterium]|nr:GerMN domain-containing protein [Clostridia bacterium]
MKKIMAALLMIAMIMAISACSPANAPKTADTTPEAGIILPAADAPEDRYSRNSATLYFRFGTEPYLAPEERIMNVSPDSGPEELLVTALLNGPESRGGILTSVFPTGTRLVSVSVNGRTAFVTLSRELMNQLPDEPENWAGNTYWSREVPLRRRLAIQSIVATLTENCDIDRVQMMLEPDEGTSTGLRLPKSYYMDASDANGLTIPAERDETLLLTPPNVMGIVMEYRKTRNWNSLYLYVAEKDPVSGEQKVSYQDLVTRMEALPQIISYEYAGGSVNSAGDRATFTVTAQVMTSGNRVAETGAGTVRLCRENGLWRISMDMLTSWPGE